ncbi:hypothetical protein BGZ83_008723 [Gryganskiella cystojenkinii]|nr:hypothetical protein BGZ83_008723 [Gryganskiella cystojenkinii]
MSDTHDQEPHEAQDEITLTDEHSPESTLKALDSPSSPVDVKPTGEVSVDQDEEPNKSVDPDDPFGSTEENEYFGNFGTTQTTTAGGAKDDEFGAFGSTDDTFQNDATADNEDDDDGFGDFGEVQAAGAGGDDDFGDFNDFADGNGFQDSDDFGDFEGTTTTGGDDPFATSESVPVAIAPSPVPEEVSVEIAPDFTATNSRQVESYVLEKLETLFPLDPSVGSLKMLNDDMEDLDISTVLSKEALWTTLSEQSFQGRNSNVKALANSPSSAPQFQWKYSELRREYYASLGLAVAKEQNTMSSGSSIPGSSTGPSSRSKVSSPLIVGSETVTERKPLDMKAALAFCQFTPENLGGYSGDEMKDIIAQLHELTRQASEELTYWLDQREQMLMDSERYNEMIASLVGRAAKLKDAESKQATKSKRLTRTSFNLK